MARTLPPRGERCGRRPRPRARRQPRRPRWLAPRSVSPGRKVLSRPLEWRPLRAALRTLRPALRKRSSRRARFGMRCTRASRARSVTRRARCIVRPASGRRRTARPATTTRSARTAARPATARTAWPGRVGSPLRWRCPYGRIRGCATCLSITRRTRRDRVSSATGRPCCQTRAHRAASATIAITSPRRPARVVTCRPHPPCTTGAPTSRAADPGVTRVRRTRANGRHCLGRSVWCATASRPTTNRQAHVMPVTGSRRAHPADRPSRVRAPGAGRLSRRPADHPSGRHDRSAGSCAVRGAHRSLVRAG